MEHNRMVEKNENINDWYSTRHSYRGEEKSVYEIWEQGGAFNDSVTPSTYCKFYQNHILMKLMGLARDKKNIFSIGCGNAVIEAELVKCGKNVLAIDCNDEAVALARGKGVSAHREDFYLADDSYLYDSQIIYADGVLGHLFDADIQLAEFEQRISSSIIRPGTIIFISNDSPSDTSLAFQKHNTLNTFWLLSPHYLENRLKTCGFDVTEKYHFPYQRPMSGVRNRTICIAVKE